MIGLVPLFSFHESFFRGEGIVNFAGYIVGAIVKLIGGLAINVPGSVHVDSQVDI